MANFWYDEGIEGICDGSILWETDDIRAILVMTDSTAGGDITAAFIGSMGNLDEYDGANYARLALTAEAVGTTGSGPVTVDFSATSPLTWASLGAGTRANLGIVFYKHVTNDADSIPIFYHEFSFVGTGQDVNAAISASGLATAQAEY